MADYQHQRRISETAKALEIAKRMKLTPRGSKSLVFSMTSVPKNVIDKYIKLARAYLRREKRNL